MLTRTMALSARGTKWVRRISFLNSNKPGFWEVRGYHDRGDPWMEERYG